MAMKIWGKNKQNTERNIKQILHEISEEANEKCCVKSPTLFKHYHKGVVVITAFFSLSRSRFYMCVETKFHWYNIPRNKDRKFHTHTYEIWSFSFFIIKLQFIEMGGNKWYENKNGRVKSVYVVPTFKNQVQF